MMDGKVLFECQTLVKQTGIDLMNCPLNVVLQLRIRRRLPQGPHVLWHVVLPLPLISKHLMVPPHEWETWIGLMPNKQVLTDHPADVMFTQAVHLISRPEFPKLRLRFTYHNKQLQEQAQAQLEKEEQESRRRKEQTEQMGRAQFQDIHKLMNSVRATGGSNASAAAAAASAAPPEPPNAAPVVSATQVVAKRSSDDPLRETYPVAVLVPDQHAAAIPVAAHAIASDQQVQAKTPCANAEADALLVEGLRKAVMGMADDTQAPIKEQFPKLCDAFREVASLAKERAALLEQQQRMQDQCRYLQDQCTKMSQEQICVDSAKEERGKQEARLHFEKLLNQQRQAMQVEFDSERGNLRQQLEDMKRDAQAKEGEVAALRGQLNDFLQSNREAAPNWTSHVVRK
jgi:hypothetical protein